MIHDRASRKKDNQQARLIQRISLVRSTRTPQQGENDVGWIRSIAPYASERAEKRNANRFVLTSINQDDETTHTFRVLQRRQPLVIQGNDFLIHRTDVYQITSTREVDGTPYLDIMVKNIGQLSGMTHTVDETLKDSPPKDTDPSHKNPFYMEGEDE